jgi:hypothetical protein
MLFVDAGNDRVGIGTSTPLTTVDIEDGLTTVGAVLTLSTKEPTVVDGDVIGRINFRAPLETGADALLLLASMHAEADATFDASTNTTDLVFSTASGDAAAERLRITSAGKVLVAGLTASEIVITDANKGLTSAAVATYPSLAELIHVKGVTSAIQTQLDATANVATNLTISGTTGARTIESSDGTNAVIPLGTTSVSGLLSPAVFDAVTANTAKTTALSTEAVQDIAGALVASGGTKTGIAVTYDDGNNNMDFVVDHDAATNFVAAEHIDWAGAGAGTIHASNYTDTTTNTQLSNAEVRTAVEAATDSNVFTDADHSKLNAITASAVSAAEAITAVEGEATLLLAGQVNLRAGIEVCTSDPAPAIAESGTVYQFTKGSAGVFTLPANPTVGVQYVLVNGTANDIVITRPASGYKINGATSNVTNTTQWAATSIVCVVAGSSGEWLVFGGI